MSEKNSQVPAMTFLSKKLTEPLDRGEMCCVIIRYFKECICLKEDFPACQAERPPESAWKPLQDVLFHRGGKSFCLYDRESKVWRYVTCLTLADFLSEWMDRQDE